MAVAENVRRLLARYSEGYRLATQHGPRSGIVAEYAYRNRPRGSGPLGRFLDRRFLHLGAWENVRRRFQATKELVREQVHERRATGRRSIILDIAAGTACYLRELVQEEGSGDLEIVCRERDARQVMHAREIVAEEGLAIDFFVGDPTDPASYLCARDPDIVIAAGVLPLLAREDTARGVLQLCFQHLAPGGCLIVTTITQPNVRMSPWEAQLPTQAVARSSETVAGWLRATGFLEVDARVFSPHDAALIARKPLEL